MKILYFYQYFSTSKGYWGTRVYEFAKEWVSKGHQVTIVTCIYSKSDLKSNKFIKKCTIDGIDLIILNINIDNRQILIKRGWTFIQYCLAASFFALRERYDVAISSSGPITTGIPGILSKMIRHKKFVFEVRDMWPETAIQTGYVKNGLVIKIMYAIEKLCYKKSDLIVTLSSGMTDNISDRFGYNHIISIPNSANIELFGRDSTKKLPKPLIPGKYVIYTGNIGKVNNSQLLLEAAKELKNRKIQDMCIVLVGEGPEKKTLIQDAVKSGLEDYLLIMDQVAKENLVPLIQQSLASVIPLLNRPVLNTSSPNKLSESLAAGVPVIQTTTGWIQKLIEREKCGITVSSEDPNELVQAIIRLRDDPKARKQMSDNSRKLAIKEFNKSILAEKMLKRIEDVYYNL